MNPITVVLAEDHTLVRKGIRSLISEVEGVEVVGEAENGREAIKLVKQHRPDIIVMDISMPILNGLEATKQIKKYFPEVRVVVLTMHTSEEYIYEIIDAGASGYILKKAVPEELMLAIQSVSRGEKFFSPLVSMKIVDKLLQKKASVETNLAHPSLTFREMEVLQLIAEGHTSREIGEILCISIKTVGAHRTHIMEKLDLHTAADLTRYAIQRGIIDSEK
jgi:two-component system response regulator NreC